MCVANSARSQMAEALAKSLCPPDYQIYSAGSAPTVINPFAIQVLSESKIMVHRPFSKKVDDLPKDFLNKLNYVITLCQEEVCPVLSSQSAIKLHWPLPDPAQKNVSDEKSIELFRQARDTIKMKIQEFLKTI